MKKKRKKLNKNKKKFFVIITCYVIVFLVTMITTFATLAWFSGDTYANNELYMGGPVYIYFGDDEENQTSGKGNLTVETPSDWDLYPGMNIHFEARAVVEGHEWTHTKPDGDGGNETVTVQATGAILRAKVRVEVYTPTGETAAQECLDLYNSVWPQLKEKALADASNLGGEWIFDLIDTNVPENNFFYYIGTGQDINDVDNCLLKSVGGGAEQESVGFLNNVVITLPPLGLDNRHAECQIRFIIVFHALQAFIPYDENDVGTIYQNDDSGRLVTDDDIGMPKPLTIDNSREIFEEAFEDLYE